MVMTLVKGGYKIAEKLAKEFMKPNSNKQKIMQKAKDSKVYKEFSEIKSGMMKKAQKDKPKNIIPSKKTMEVRERAAFDAKEKSKVDRAAKKKKKLESVGAFNRAREERKTAGTSYGMKKGGAITKRPMGGKVYKNIVKKPMGGKVYKVDNSGQQMVAKQYGGKIDG